ncbi:hypothetical protein [Candidatus Williamhamiltonella defendens]|uniref:hypothetical protein n=1 Tax=Candidatus Williamhamiltonella defendens TaxID=138072 RepID=UPI0016517682|nr:hypothetical protein [Candidatus Hamiltonella defensa]
MVKFQGLRLIEEENIVIFEGERAKEARYVVLMGSCLILMSMFLLWQYFSIYRRITFIDRSQKNIFYNL